MKEASQHPDQHRMAVLPADGTSPTHVHLIDAKNLTTKNQRRILSRAMETEGQDNTKLLTKIRERQDRCDHSRY